MRFINYMARSLVTTTMISGATLMGVMLGWVLKEISYEERTNKNED